MRRREAFTLDAYSHIANVVKMQVARVPMATIVVESPPMTTKALPLQFCAEIIDVPEVRAAIEAAIKAAPRRR